MTDVTTTWTYFLTSNGCSYRARWRYDAKDGTPLMQQAYN